MGLPNIPMAATPKLSDGSLGIPMSIVGGQMPRDIDTTWIFEHRCKTMPTEVDKTCIFEHRSKKNGPRSLRTSTPPTPSCKSRAQLFKKMHQSCLHQLGEKKNAVLEDFQHDIIDFCL